MKRTGVLFTILGVVIATLLMVQISVSNMLSTGGIKLSDIQDQIQGLQRQNAILKEKILSVSSLTYISEQAGKEGFIQDKTQAVVVTNDQPPIAYNQ